MLRVDFMQRSDISIIFSSSSTLHYIGLNGRSDKKATDYRAIFPRFYPIISPGIYCVIKLDQAEPSGQPNRRVYVLYTQDCFLVHQKWLEGPPFRARSPHGRKSSKFRAFFSKSRAG